MEIEAEKLIEQNPRDSLILRRQKNLNHLKERDFLIKLDRAEKIYYSCLRRFAMTYLAESDPDVFESLDPKEKKALGEIYASLCKFKLIRHSSILTAISGSLATYLFMNKDPVGMVLISTILFIFYTVAEGPKYLTNYISYLKSHKIMLKK